MQNTSDSLGLEMETCVQEIKDGAEKLQVALMKRNTAGILEAVEVQQVWLDKLRPFYAELYARAGATAREPVLEPSRSCSSLLLQTRAVLRRNRSLATAFLAVIDRAFSRIEPARSATGTYDAVGKQPPISGPLLLHRKV